ncbi:unnamed protein product, partial [Durusdinium trenchii]
SVRSTSSTSIKCLHGACQWLSAPSDPRLGVSAHGNAGVMFSTLHLRNENRECRQRLPSLGLGPWATAGTEAICDQVVPWMLMTSHTSPPHVHRPQGLKAYPMAANLLENQERPQGSLPLAKPCFSGCVQHWK